MGKNFKPLHSQKRCLLGTSAIILISFLVLSSLLIIKPSAFAAKPTKDAVSVGGIAGVLQFCEGNPRGIVVAIPGTSYSAKSNRSGNFSLGNIPPGSYQLIATTNGQQIGLLNNVQVVANQTTNVGTWPVCTDPDMDGDGFKASVDCDDNDPDINPGASEICNQIDDDCDGVKDNGCCISPTITDVEPRTISTREGSNIHIYGTDLIGVTQVLLFVISGDTQALPTPLTNLRFVQENELEASVPIGLFKGSYDLVIFKGEYDPSIRFSDHCFGALSNAILITD